MKTQVLEGKIICLTRLNNSYYGNPRYEVVVELKECEYKYIVGKTLYDGAIGYAISNYHVNDTIKLEYHETRSGNIIFDKIIK